LPTFQGFLWKKSLKITVNYSELLNLIKLIMLMSLPVVQLYWTVNSSA